MAQCPRGFDILDVAPGLPDDALAAALDLRRRIDVEAQPEFEPMDAPEFRAYMDDRTENGVHLRYVGLVDGSPAALGHLELPRNPANAQLAFVQMEVDPGLERRRARPPVADLVAGAAADGRTSVMAFGRLSDAEDADWTSVGQRDARSQPAAESGPRPHDFFLSASLQRIPGGSLPIQTIKPLMWVTPTWEDSRSAPPWSHDGTYALGVPTRRPPPIRSMLVVGGSVRLG